MEVTTATRTNRLRGNNIHDSGRRPHSRNKQWVAGGETRSGTSTPHLADGERWERGGHRGGGRGRGGMHWEPRKPVKNLPTSENVAVDEQLTVPPEDPVLETQEEREKFYQDLVKAREVERKKAIQEGTMDDPLVPKRLEDAITMVGTCQDMCPRFERYRRERENNLFEWETIPGTKRVDHKRAVKMYERAAGDKTLPSDLRPPHVLKKTLDYLFHDLVPRAGFSPTFNFVRDRSRAVRNDFTMQHEQGELAIECHDRCARFHILALHFERGRRDFSVNMEEQQLMNTLQSLKEFYEDQRGSYESPSELEMRVYHRLIHIRDQKERHEDVPEHIREHPVFKLTTEFRLHVQKKSEPIRKNSPLVVDGEAMQIFGRLAGVLREMGNVVMIYLVACILEHLFGKDAIDNIESIRGELTIPNVIDGVSVKDVVDDEVEEADTVHDEMLEGDEEVPEVIDVTEDQAQVQPSAPQWPSASPFGAKASTSIFGVSESSSPQPPQPQTQTRSAFSNLTTASTNPFGTQNVFGPSAFSASPSSAPFGGAINGFSAFAQAAQATSASLSNGQASSASSKPLFPASASLPSSSNTPKPEFLGAKPNVFGNISTEAKTDSTPFPSSVPSPAFPSAPLPGSTPSLPSSFGEATKIFGSPVKANGLKPSPLNPQAPSFSPFSTSAPAPPSTAAAPKMSLADAPPLSSSSAATPPATTAAPNVFNGGLSSFNPTQLNSTAQPNTTPTPSFFNTTSSRAPPPLKLDIATPVQPDASTATPPAFFVPLPMTPTTSFEPPPAPRPETISLPSTPTLPPTATHPRLDLLKGSLVTSGLPTSGSSGDILSPLQLNSPTLSRQGSLNFLHNFGPISTPKIPSSSARSSFSFEALPHVPASPSPLNGEFKNKGKGKGKATEDDLIEPTEEEIVQAEAFERCSTVVKTAFALWRNKHAEHAAYAEAVRHGESYRNRIHSQRKNQATNGVVALPNEKRRRMSSSVGSMVSDMPHTEMDDIDMRSPLKKRARRRISKESKEYHVPRTDEELARRLKENQEEHQRRWAPGSFLQVLRKHVKGKAAALLAGESAKALAQCWRVWLSMNPEVDGTAIWLEKKFAVPEAGEWVSQAVFSIPLVPRAPSGYPGVIVFECTPLDGVSDELERKYRILDDCTRLRDILQSLPAKRYFVPSLLLFHWSEGEGSTVSQDLLDMISGFLEEDLLASMHAFSITASTKDLDAKFGQALESLSMDIEGRLVRTLSFPAVFKLFDELFDSFIQEWMENCSTIGDLGWGLFGRLLSSVIDLLNEIIKLASGLIDKACGTPMPEFPASEVDDVESIYEIAIQWLSDLNLPQHTSAITADLQAHHDMGKIFPAQIFIDNLRDLVRYLAEISLGSGTLSSSSSSNMVFYIPASEIENALQAFTQAIQPHQALLSQTLNLRLRRSPKRRSSLSTADSPTSSKRLRLSASASASVGSYLSRSPTPNPNPNSNSNSSPYMNGRHSPSPSESSFSVVAPSPEAPAVTVSMLRALTKNLKEKYGGP